MINVTFKLYRLIPIFLILSQTGFAQENFILDNPGMLFKKNERKVPLPVKTRYFFETSPATGREYLRQQDLLDPKGKIKSSGVFSDDGNKAGDIRYTYDASGVLQKIEQKKIGKNEVEITYLHPSGKPSKIEKRTKTDSLIGTSAFIYDEKGNLKEESVYRGEKLISKRVVEDLYNSQGKLLQSYQFVRDSIGNTLPGAKPFEEHEYDDKGMILQTTVYNNKDKRKMLNWVYYKYQLDNDYKVIRQTGYNEEQLEISKVELAYTDSSILETSFQLCNCPEKTMEKTGSRQFVYNSFGELIRIRVNNAAGQLVQTSSFRYDDFGNCVDTLIEKIPHPSLINRSKVILEFYTDQAKITK